MSKNHVLNILSSAFAKAKIPPLTKMTNDQQDRTLKLLKKIELVLQTEKDPQIVINALSLLQLEITRVECDLTEREAVDYCSESIKLFGQAAYGLDIFG